MKISSIAMISILIAVGARCAVLIYATFFPIKKLGDRYISPLHAEGSDFGFYEVAAQLQRDLRFEEIVDLFSQFYASWNYKLVEFVDVGPLFPTLINLFNYEQGNTIPMALVWMALSAACCMVWIFWLRGQQASPYFLAVVALLPSPIWYGLSVSTDMLFAFCFSLFFVNYFRPSWNQSHILIWLSCCILMAITRPSVLSVLLFVCVDLTRRMLQQSPYIRSYLLGFMIIVGLLTALFYLPYFYGIFFFVRDKPPLTYFGVSPSEYINGLFSELPQVIDQALSLILYIIAKLLYLVGMRPSYGDTSALIVAVRAAPSLLLLPGLVWIILRGSTPLRLLVLMFVIPTLFGPSQERYLLPIQPLLAYWGMIFWQSCFHRRQQQNTIR